MTTIIPHAALPAATSPPAGNEPRSRRTLCEAARFATCGHCWQEPGIPCATKGGTHGYHVARFGRAERRGLITGRELVAVLYDLGVFDLATVVWDEPTGGAR